MIKFLYFMGIHEEDSFIDDIRFWRVIIIDNEAILEMRQERDRVWYNTVIMAFGGFVIGLDKESGIDYIRFIMNGAMFTRIGRDMGIFREFNFFERIVAEDTIHI